MAAALNGETYTQFVQGVLDKKPNARPLNRRNCFTCGQLGHFSRTCPKKFKPPPINQKAPSAPETSPALAGGGNQPQILCPRCQKGYHWARDCRSKFHKNGTPSAIVLEQPAAQPSWNGQQGLPQAQTIMGASSLNPFIPFVPSQNSAERPQAVQDWTCVPPPQQSTPNAAVTPIPTGVKGPLPEGIVGLILGGSSLALQGIL